MRRTGFVTWLAGFGLAAALAASAAAQSGNRGMIAIDDGNERHALSYAQPDLEAILKPYIARTDLPTFEKYLTLSDAQLAAVERFIADYLEQFQQLVHDKHPAPADADEQRRGPMIALVDPRQRQAPEDDGGGGVMEDADVDDDGGAPEEEVIDIQDILAEELKADGIIKESLDELPVDPGFTIGISMSATEEDPEPRPSIDVSISFGGEDDSLSEELRAKLEAAAERAVPRIAEVVRGQAMMDMAARMAGQEVGRSPAEEIAARYDELEELRLRIAEFQKEAELLLNQLYANVKRLLSEQQLEQWPAFERALRRVKTIAWGRLDGESTDLIEVVEDLELDGSQLSRLAEHLKTYELSLDAALKRRNNLLDESDAIIDRALYIGEFGDAQSMADRVNAARVTIRDLNDRMTETLSSSLEGRTVERLRREALAVSYPKIYRRTTGQQAFDETITMENLDSELLVLVLELAQQHGQRIEEVNDRLFRSVRREQEQRILGEIERTIANLQDLDTEFASDDDDTQTAIAKAFQERRDIDARYMTMLYEMLPEAMVAQLPAVPKHKVGEEVGAAHHEEPDQFEFH